MFSVLTYEGLKLQKRTNKLEHVQHIKCKPSIPVIKDNTNKRSSYSQTLLRPYDTVKRTREILISNIHLLSPQKWSQFVIFNIEKAFPRGQPQICRGFLIISKIKLEYL